MNFKRKLILGKSTALSALLCFLVTIQCEAAGNQNATKIPFPALVTACKVAANDKYFEKSPTLLLVFPVGAQYSMLYEVRADSTRVGLADMHYDEGGLDAQGGVWSLNRAGDAYDYLATKAFKFFKSEEEFQSSAYLKNASECKIEYKNMKGYER